MKLHGMLTISVVVQVEPAGLPGEFRKVCLAKVERNTNISLQDAEVRVSHFRSLNPGVQFHAEFKPFPLHL